MDKNLQSYVPPWPRTYYHWDAELETLFYWKQNKLPERLRTNLKAGAKMTLQRERAAVNSIKDDWKAERGR